MTDPHEQIAEERQLVARCQAGEASAQRLLVQRFQSLVIGTCVRMLGNQHDAEDVAQDVFVRAFRSLHQWDGVRPLRPWILTITANRCRTAWAKRKKLAVGVEVPEDFADPARGNESDERSEFDELKAGIGNALAQLRDEYRQVFLLFHEQQLSYEEIGELIGKPVGTIKTWLHRARQEMVDCLTSRGLVSATATLRMTSQADKGRG